MARASGADPAPKRTQISRAALEMAIANAVRSSDPHCNAFVCIIVERVSPASRVAMAGKTGESRLIKIEIAGALFMLNVALISAF
jgi:hypothetical protein